MQVAVGEYEQMGRICISALKKRKLKRAFRNWECDYSSCLVHL